MIIPVSKEVRYPSLTINTIADEKQFLVMHTKEYEETSATRSKRLDFFDCNDLDFIDLYLEVKN